MLNIHCYNDKCINGGSVKNCSHEDCNLEWYPAMAKGDDDCLAYCERACKAKCVNLEITTAPGKKLTTKEMQVRLKQMKQDYLNKKAMSQGEGDIQYEIKEPEVWNTETVKDADSIVEVEAIGLEAYMKQTEKILTPEQQMEILNK